jgi:hypothetical protein
VQEAGEKAATEEATTEGTPTPYATDEKEDRERERERETHTNRQTVAAASSVADPASLDGERFVENEVSQSMYGMACVLLLPMPRVLLG